MSEDFKPVPGFRMPPADVLAQIAAHRDGMSGERLAEIAETNIGDLSYGKLLDIAQELLAEVSRAHAVGSQSARDTARLDVIESDLDAMRWVRPAGHPAGEWLELNWFVPDGGGHSYTHGATIREAADAYLAQLAGVSHV